MSVNPNPEQPPAINVFVHLAYGFSAERWHDRWLRKTLIGINEPYAYGYHRAASMGCHVTYSSDHPENKLQTLLRLGMRVLLGFDFIHAWRNRQGILAADVVWTHNESQSLGVGALLKILAGKRRPKTIFQTVWLIDRYQTAPPPIRWLYRFLLRQGDVLSFLSPENAAMACTIFPGKNVEFVPYGINADTIEDARPPRPDGLVHVLSIGNDRHRDWKTLKQALAGEADLELRVVTATLPATYFSGNAAVCKVTTNDALNDMFAWADVMVVPLKPNFHASGITVILEALIQGLPVICTDTGGLRGYFGDDEVLYVKPADPVSLKGAVNEFRQNRMRHFDMTQRAQVKIKTGSLNSVAYVRRHVELSKQELSSL